MYWRNVNQIKKYAVFKTTSNIACDQDFFSICRIKFNNLFLNKQPIKINYSINDHIVVNEVLDILETNFTYKYYKFFKFLNLHTIHNSIFSYLSTVDLKDIIARLFLIMINYLRNIKL